MGYIVNGIYNRYIRGYGLVMDMYGYIGYGYDGEKTPGMDNTCILAFSQLGWQT